MIASLNFDREKVLEQQIELLAMKKQAPETEEVLNQL